MGLISKQIVNTDLFGVFPGKSSPLNIGAGLPCQFSDVSAVGEKVVLDDDSAIAVPDGEVLGESHAFSSLLADPELRYYLFGRGQHKTFYRITYVDSGVWSLDIAKLRRLLMSMSGDEIWSEDLSHHMGYSGGNWPCLGNLRHAGIYRCALWRIGKPEIAGVVAKLQQTPPPVRVSIPRQGSPHGPSMFYATAAEDGAELLMGWRHQGIYERMHVERNAIAQGVLPAINGINGVAAHADHWYGAHPFSPFGMTGDVKGIRIDANGPSLSVYDWGRINASRLWDVAREKLTSVGVERLFSEGTVLRARAKAPEDRRNDPDFHSWGTNIIASPLHNPKRGMSYHPLETGAFIVHHIKLEDWEESFFPIAPGSPSTFVAMRGKIAIESPHHLKLTLCPDQAAFVPAMRYGDYITKAVEGPAEFIVVQNALRSLARLVANAEKNAEEKD